MIFSSLNIADIITIFLYVGLGIYSIGISFILYHLLRFGIGWAPKVIAILLLLFTTIAIGNFLFTLSQIDWQTFFNDLPNIFSINLGLTF